MMRWHVSVMCLHWECLFTDCPFVNDDSLTCQSCIHIGSVCSLIVQSPLIIHWHVSVLCVHWEWQVHRLSSRHLWFSDVSQSCVYIGNVCSPIVQWSFITQWHVSVLCLHIRRLLTDCSPSLMVHGHVSAGQCRNDEHNESVTRRWHLKNAHSLSRITRLQLKTKTPPVMTDMYQSTIGKAVMISVRSVVLLLGWHFSR